MFFCAYTVFIVNEFAEKIHSKILTTFIKNLINLAILSTAMGCPQSDHFILFYMLESQYYTQNLTNKKFKFFIFRFFEIKIPQQWDSYWLQFEPIRIDHFGHIIRFSLLTANILCELHTVKQRAIYILRDLSLILRNSTIYSVFWQLHR